MKLYIYSPKTKSVQATIKFRKNTNAVLKSQAVPQYKGGDDNISDADFDLPDIDENIFTGDTSAISNNVKSNTFTSGSKNSDIMIFDEDNLFELREKVRLATNIPIYRQHLFYLTKDGKYRCMYKLFMNGLVDVDIRNINDIVIDNELYIGRDDITIEAYDNFATVGSEQITELYCVDLFSLTTFADITDKYQQDLTYWGFVVKYFPIITYPVYKTLLIEGENQMVSIYPLLYTNEEILEKKHKNQEKILARPNDIKIEASILRANISPHTDEYPYTNIRNLFDILRTSRKIPYIRAIINIENHDYLLEKYWNGLPRESRINKIPKLTILTSGLTMVLPHVSDKFLGNTYINITPNKKPYIIANFHEEEKMGFREIYEEIKKHITPIFNEINKNSLYIGGEIPIINMGNIEYENINISIIWNKTIYNSDITRMQKVIEKYKDCDIFGHRTTQHGLSRDNIELTIKKGIHNYNEEIIQSVIEYSGQISTSSVATSGQLNNYYDYLSDSFTNQKWTQVYGGKIVNIKNKIVYLQFLFNDITQNEFAIVKKLLGFLIKDAGLEHIEKGTIESTKTSRMLAKFNNEDPELFNLKRHGLPTVYARYCQGKMQPEMASLQEYDEMSKGEKSAWTQYWNFTKKQPVYYKCNHSEYPYLSFRVNIHPKGYCIPCCKKKIGDVGKGKLIQEQCMKNYMYFNENDTDMPKYIMQYSADRQNEVVGRLMYLPSILSEAFTSYKIEIVEGDDYFDELTVDYIVQFTYDASNDKINIEIPRTLLSFVRISNMEEDHFTFACKFGDRGIIKYIENQNKYFAKSEGEKKAAGIFHSRDDNLCLVKYILNMSHEENKKMEHNKLLTFSIFILIVRKYEGEIDIIKLLKRLDNKLYGAIIKTKKGGYIHVPIWPSEINYINDIKKIPIVDQFKRNEWKINAKDTFNFIKKIDDYFPFPFEITKVFVDDKDVVKTIMCNDEYMFYCDTGDISTIKGDVPVALMEYDPVDVNNQIIEGRSPCKDNRVLHYDSAIYYNYVYHLLILEVLYKIDKEKNSKMRTKIKNILLNKEDNLIVKNKKILSIENLPEIDKSVIGSIITKLYFSGSEMKPNDLVDFILADKYQFDRKTLQELSGMTPSERLKAITKIAGDVVHFSDKKFTGKIENIYTPCGYQYSDYCKGKKLIISKKDFNNFIKILSEDIVNPIKFDHMIDNLWIENIIEYLRFKVYDDEEIIIRPL